MQTSQRWDDTEARLQLDDASKDEQEKGLRWVDENLRKPICGWVRRHFPSLSSEDLRDIWQEVLVALHLAVAESKFDANKPLGPWLATVARNRAIDKVRAATSHQKNLEVVGRCLQDATEVPQKWRGMSAEEKQAFQEEMRDFIRKLPRNQRTVFQIYVNYFGQITMAELYRLVSHETNGAMTQVAVKRALQEAREKARLLLSRRQYTRSNGNECTKRSGT